MRADRLEAGLRKAGATLELAYAQRKAAMEERDRRVDEARKAGCMTSVISSTLGIDPGRVAHIAEPAGCGMEVMDDDALSSLQRALSAQERYSLAVARVDQAMRARDDAIRAARAHGVTYARLAAWAQTSEGTVYRCLRQR